jgi:hypothetical protein
VPIAAAAAAAAGTAAAAEIPDVAAVRTPPGISNRLGKRFILGNICSCSKGVGSDWRKVGRCRHVSQRVEMVSSVFKNSQEVPQKFKNTCCKELNPRRLTNEFFWVNKTKHLILFRTEVSFRCLSFTIEEFP